MKTSVSLGCFAVGALIAALVFGWHPIRSRADSPIPTVMDLRDAAALHAEIAELRLLSLQEEPHKKVIAAICSRAKIDPAELGRTVGVDFETGAITRASQAAPAAPPAKAKK